MKRSHSAFPQISLARIVSISLLLFAATSLPTFAQTSDLFVSFHDTDTVSLYDAITGALVAPTFASISSPTGLTIGPDQNLYVGSDSVSAEDGAGIVRFGINGATAGPSQNFVTHVTDNNLNNPRGLAFIGANLYVADITAKQIFTYDTSGSPVAPPPGASIQAPSGLSAVAGNLYIADSDAGNVLRYDGVNVTQVNAVNNVFNSANDVSLGHDGNLYVLNPSLGIYRLSLSDGSATRIVDYSTSFFEATDMVVGPDGKLYVSGQDENGVGGVFQYGTDGSGGGIFANTGQGTMPDALAFDIPEPTTLSLATLAIAVFAVLKLRSLKRANSIF